MAAKTFLLQRLLKKPWIWAYIGTLIVWLITISFTRGQGAGDIVTAALSFATFTVIVGIGQMLVITTGPGNIDLSIPANIALSGAVTMKIMDGSNEMLLV